MASSSILIKGCYFLFSLDVVVGERRLQHQHSTTRCRLSPEPVRTSHPQGADWGKRTHRRAAGDARLLQARTREEKEIFGK